MNDQVQGFDWITEVLAAISICAICAVFLYGCTDDTLKPAAHFGLKDNGKVITGNGTQYAPEDK